MRAIDPHAVHAALQQVVNESEIVRRLARHGDHDPTPPPRRRGSKKGFGMRGQEALSGGEIDALVLRQGRRRGAAGEPPVRLRKT